MTNVIAKKILAAALTVSTLTGGMAATTTATVFTTTAAVSVLSTAPAEAAQCFTRTVKATASSAGGIAKFRKRRAERRAVRAWERDVASRFAGNLADFDDARNKSVVFGVTARGNTSATVTGTVIVCI